MEERAIKNRGEKASKQLSYLLMCTPGLVWMILFQFVPMSGIVIAFQKFVPKKGLFGSKFIGLENFEYLFSLSEVWRVVDNTLIIAVSKLVLLLLVPLCFALMLNRVRNMAFKKTVQTVTYLPHFISWVILANIITNMFGYDGVINQVVVFLGGEAKLFLGDAGFFRWLLILSDVWKEFGFNSIIFLAALSGVNPQLYEAAAIDGANSLTQLWYVTLPGISSTVVLVLVLSLGNVLNAGFDQVYNMYNSLVMSSSDIIDTWIYRMGLIKMNFSLSTAAGLLKSVVSMILISVSYALAYKFSDYRIF